ncbi:MAG TPA: glycosyltransferase [Thermoanaerobaculia bacterium]|nr:glycosyltransferase [Thermoanaerobaculia bacterium]
MNLAFVVERPTQFEAPLFRFAASDPEHRLRVIFTDPQLAEPVFDPELGRSVSWGFDLLAGYDHAVCPPDDRRRWLAAEMARQRYDLVIVNGYTRKPYLLAAALARRAGLATALRLDSVLWDGVPDRPLVKGLLFAAYLIRMYDLFLGTGTLTLDYLRFFGVPEERMGLFPYAVDVDDFRRRSRLAPRETVRERWGVPAGARVLLSVAKLSPREAPWDLLRAFARSDRTGDPGLWLVIAGDGPSRPELEAFVSRRRLERVRFLGYVPYPELPSLYAAADLFVHPAREERWGVSVAEALACGLPVITSSRVGAARDLLVSGENGFTYEAGDDAALARRIGDALRLDPDAVEAQNREILARWDYAATWQGILRAAERLPRRTDR